MPHTRFDFLELISAWWGMKPFSVAVWLIPPHSLRVSAFNFIAKDTDYLAEICISESDLSIKYVK